MLPFLCYYYALYFAKAVKLNIWAIIVFINKWYRWLIFCNTVFDYISIWNMGVFCCVFNGKAHLFFFSLLMKNYKLIIFVINLAWLTVRISRIFYAFCWLLFKLQKTGILSVNFGQLSLIARCHFLKRFFIWHWFPNNLSKR